MRTLWSGTTIQRAVVTTCALLIALPASFAQAPEDQPAVTPDMQQAAPLLAPDQLDNLVAPVALYPDPLLSQVLSASTYPLEIVEAQQWRGQNSNLQGAQLMDAARQQNWDPSVQALVAFPNAFSLLANDIRWTTDLGNAFLAQQADLMGAVQRMRARARANGKLTTTPQQVVTMATQDDQNAIEIQPADPQVIYVPTYNPAYVWGPPAWGEYPDLWYPSGYGFGFGFGPGYYMSSYFPSWGGWGGWGWGCGWFGRGLFVNTGFFSRYGYRGGYAGGGYGGRSAWMHNSGHRLGIPYPNRAVASRFGGGARATGGQWSGARSGSGRAGPSQLNRTATGAGAGGSRSAASGGWQRFGGANQSPSAARTNARGSAQSYRQPSSNNAANGGSRSYQAPAQSGRRSGSAQSYRSSPSTGQSAGQSSSRAYSAPRGGGYSAPRSYSAPSQSYSAPRSSSGPRVSGGGGYSAPRSSSGARASGGGSGSSGGRSGGNSGSSGGRSSGNSNSGSSGGRSNGGGGNRR